MARRIVLINQFYPPDQAPTGLYLHDLGRALARRGHVVVALCSRGAYAGPGDYRRSDRIDGVRVRRVATMGASRRNLVGKAIASAAFWLGAAIDLATHARRADLVVVLSTPPWIGLMVAWVCRWAGTKRMHWIMDLYPDALTANASRPAAPCLGRLTRRELAGARGVIVPGSRMARRVRAYLAGPGPVILPLWSRVAAPTDAEAAAERVRKGWDGADLVLLYSGNLGRGHPVEDILSAAAAAGSDGPRWAFAGDGPRRAEVESFIRSNPGCRVELSASVPEPRLPAHLGAADVLIATLDDAWTGIIVPSKLQGMFAVGRPVILLGGEGSEAADWIRSSGGGWVIARGDLAGLQAAVAQAADARVRRERGAAAAAFARSRFSSRNIDRMVRCIDAGTRAV